MFKIKEIWKDIPNYEGLYQVSNMGNVRRIKFINNQIIKNKIYYLKPNYKQYVEIILCKEGKPKNYMIHKLVAKTFLNKNNFKKMCEEKSIDTNKLEINHKDEDKYNNCVNNLEWCSHLYNMNYGNVKKKISDSHKKRG